MHDRPAMPPDNVDADAATEPAPEPERAAPGADGTTNGARPANDAAPMEPAAEDERAEPVADEQPQEGHEPAEEPSVEVLAARAEAILFVSDGPVPERTLAEVLGVRRRSLAPALDALAERLRAGGLRLQRGPEGAQLVTAPLAAEVVEAFLGLEAGRRLSRAALETLAIVAYRQPVTRAQIDAIRGVSSEGALATLRARSLVDEVGRADSPGRPTLFGTTQRFLEHFGLERPEELPPLPSDIELPEPERQLPLPDAPGDAASDAPAEAQADAPTDAATDAPADDGAMENAGSPHEE